MAAGERLQKVLARAGVASRRHAETLITAGRVRVNGRVVTELGTRVDARKDVVELDGKRLTAEPIVYFMFHKPRGTVTTLNDPEGRPSIADYLKSLPARVYPVGRLDFHTSGALLLTNDGELAQALLHPRRAVPKTYVGKVRGIITDEQLDQLRKGVLIAPTDSEPEVVRTLPAEVEILRHGFPGGIDAASRENDDDATGTTWLKITLREGRNRQIHRMADAVGLFVMRLARISFAGLNTDGLRPGELRELTEKELTMLRSTWLRPVENAKEGSTENAEREPAEARGERSPKRKDTERRAPKRNDEAATPRREPRTAGRASDERRPRRESSERTSSSGRAPERERSPEPRRTSTRDETRAPRSARSDEQPRSRRNSSRQQSGSRVEKSSNPRERKSVEKKRR